jgi:hypothetical protein
MSKNEHPREESWLDLARGTTTPDTADLLRRHLKEGCAECGRIYRGWLLVTDASRDPFDEPPMEAVQAAAAAFGFQRRVPSVSGAAKMARLILDSFRTPLPAGVRGGRTAARQLAYHAGEYSIDVRLEGENDGKVSLAGQILRRNAPPSATACVGVILADAKAWVVAQTIANSAGEFHLNYEEQDDLTMYLQLAGPPLIGVPLPTFPSESGIT